MMFTTSVSCVHLSPVNDTFVRMSAKCCVVLTCLMWIIGSRLMRSTCQSTSTRCVRDAWRSVGFLRLFICFITASSSSKMFYDVRMQNNREMVPDVLGFDCDEQAWTRLQLGDAIFPWLRPTNSLLECPPSVILHQTIWEQVSDNSLTISRSSGFTWWSSKQSVETLWSWSTVLCANSHGVQHAFTRDHSCRSKKLWRLWDSSPQFWHLCLCWSDARTISVFPSHYCYWRVLLVEYI